MVAYFCKVLLISAFLNVAWSKAPAQGDDLRSLIETLQTSYEGKIAMLTKRLEVNERECNRKMLEFGQRILHLESRNQNLIQESSTNKKKISSLITVVNRMSEEMSGEMDNGKTYKGDVMKNEKEVSFSSSRNNVIGDKGIRLQVYQPRYHRRTTRALDDNRNIAFTAYLDHDLENQGPDQTLVFNKVLLNDGNAYNSFIGVFTVPVTGVYSFTFFVGQRDINEVRAYLVVNNKHQVDAAAESVHSAQDLQGGNTAVLHLIKGDSVYVTHQGIFHHIEGDDILRTTTFSGFLIYPVEDLTIVGK